MKVTLCCMLLYTGKNIPCIYSSRIFFKYSKCLSDSILGSVNGTNATKAGRRKRSMKHF